MQSLRERRWSVEHSKEKVDVTEEKVPGRVELAVPGSNEKMMAKAAASKADMVFLDLEDAVAPNAKVAARSKIVAALKELDWTGKTTCVRINDLGTEGVRGRHRGGRRCPPAPRPDHDPEGAPGQRRALHRHVALAAREKLKADAGSASRC
jgi:hypothetical protein